MRRILFLLTIGLGGVATLIWLGVWQLQRLEWKESMLADIEARIAAAATELPLAPQKDDDNYMPVVFTGTPTETELRVLSSGTDAGTGYRVISAWVVGDRRILVDMGIIPLAATNTGPHLVTQTVQGNMLWPDDAAEKSPAPEGDLWFARDASAMAAELGTEPFMVVLRASDNPDPRLIPVPVNKSGISNNHMEYAITWFLLAIVWAAMSAFFFYRTSKKEI
jgi:surfeit locus 1 family protein